MISIKGVSGDMVLSSCLRYDLAPIPLTLEAKIRLTPATSGEFQDGKVIRVNEIDFRIIKCEPIRNAGSGTQGDYPLSAVSITAFPDSVVGVALGRRAAVIAKNTSFSSLYRSCGATVGVSGDIAIGRFACFKGEIPTFHLAKVLQEESAVLIWRAGKIHLMRLRDVMAQKPIDSITVESSEDIRSSFLESDQIPVYFSIGADGKFLSAARRNDGQSAVHAPRKNARELGLMGRVLVRRKIITGAPNLGLRAGDVIDVRGTPLVVMTAAHFTQNGTGGDGANQYSRLWLGSLS